MECGGPIGREGALKGTIMKLFSGIAQQARRSTEERSATRPARTEWSDARLQRLFERYNRLYWGNGLPHHRVVMAAIGGPAQGQCTPGKDLIEIDPAKHRSAHEIRSTLLHEMAHVATCSEGHDLQFFAQIERLLRCGSPLAEGAPEAGAWVWAVGGVVPRRFPLLRACMQRAERERTRFLASFLLQNGHKVH